MYDPDDSNESEQDYYERRAETQGCDTPDWFDADLMPVFADAADALADMEGGAR
jgi:hypothetical protein